MAVPTKDEAAASALQQRIIDSRNKINDYEQSGYKKTDAWKAEVRRMNALIADREKLIKRDADNRTEFRVRSYTVYACIVMLTDALNRWERQAAQLWEMKVDGQPTAIAQLIDIERGLSTELYAIVERVGGCAGAKYAEEFADLVDDTTDHALSQVMDTMRRDLIRRGAKKLLMTKK